MVYININSVLLSLNFIEVYKLRINKGSVCLNIHKKVPVFLFRLLITTAVIGACAPEDGTPHNGVPNKETSLNLGSGGGKGLQSTKKSTSVEHKDVLKRLKFIDDSRDKEQEIQEIASNVKMKFGEQFDYPSLEQDKEAEQREIKKLEEAYEDENTPYKEMKKLYESQKQQVTQMTDLKDKAKAIIEKHKIKKNPYQEWKDATFFDMLTWYKPSDLQQLPNWPKLIPAEIEILEKAATHYNTLQAMEEGLFKERQTMYATEKSMKDLRQPLEKRIKIIKDGYDNKKQHIKAEIVRKTQQLAQLYKGIEQASYQLKIGAGALQDYKASRRPNYKKEALQDIQKAQVHLKEIESIIQNRKQFDDTNFKHHYTDKIDWESIDKAYMTLKDVYTNLQTAISEV